MVAFMLMYVADCLSLNFYFSLSISCVKKIKGKIKLELGGLHGGLKGEE